MLCSKALQAIEKGADVDAYTVAGETVLMILSAVATTPAYKVCVRI